MLSNKRKLGDIGLERRVRARKFDDSDVEYESENGASDDGSDGPEEEGVHQLSDEDDEDGEEEEEEEGGDESEGESGVEDDEPPVDLAKFSFGDLLKAQKALNKESSKKKLEEASEDPRGKDSRPKAPKPTRDSSASKRSSKHAPTEMSSKRPVRRGNGSAFEDSSSKIKRGDPRFDPLVGQFDEAQFRRNYAFLDEYRDKEIKALKAEIKKTRDDAKKEDLKRQVKSMEGKRDSQKRKDEERRVLDEHKRKEKELVKQGKQPFYLKKSEQKKQLLTQRFESMSKGQAEKTIVRRRKKIASKDRRELAHMERAADARARGR